LILKFALRCRHKKTNALRQRTWCEYKQLY